MDSSTMNIMNTLTSYSAQELIDTPFPPRGYVLEPWFRTGETAAIWAASGLGKTWMSLSIALAVAGGGSFGEWTAPEARRVLYIDGEMNQEDLKDRIAGLLDRGAVSVPDKALALSNLQIIARQAQDIGQGFLDITNEDHQASILKKVQGRFDLVIFDNLTTMSEGLADENEATEFKGIQNLFMQLKAAKVAGILIHHSNKTGKQMRGSTALETTFEVILGLQKPDQWFPHGAAFIAEFTKYRGERDRRTEAKTWTLPKGLGWTLEDAEPEEARSLPAVRLLRTGRFKTQGAIAKELGVDPGTVSRQFQKAKDANVLTTASIKEWLTIGEGHTDGFAHVDEKPW